MFVSSNVDMTNNIAFGPIGMAAAVTATCPCSDGTRYFFNTTTQTDWNQIIGNNMQEFVLRCPGTMACVCSSPTVCYMPSTDNIDLVFAPFCSGGTCASYMLLMANAATDAMNPAAGSTGSPITYGSQLDASGNFMMLPDSYQQINAVGCGGCPLQMNC
ncbi:hypothetical protein L596_011599 [Steinernema carpocapsae]|nr:hypothetical protein L596_011599 [Steinernema carpocapsae]